MELFFQPRIVAVPLFSERGSDQSELAARLDSVLHTTAARIGDGTDFKDVKLFHMGTAQTSGKGGDAVELFAATMLSFEVDEQDINATTNKLKIAIRVRLVVQTCPLWQATPHTYSCPVAGQAEQGPRIAPPGLPSEGLPGSSPGCTCWLGARRQVAAQCQQGRPHGCSGRPLKVPGYVHCSNP